MSEAEKGTGKIHILHEGEIVLNRPTTQRLLDVLGISKDTAMKMAPATLMKRVKTVIDQAKREVDKVKTPSPEGAKKAPARMAGGMSRPARKAPARMAGGMSRPARKAPARQKGGMAASEAREERDKRLGRHPMRDTL